MSAKHGLGRGLESLIPTDVIDEAFDPTANQDSHVSELRHIPLTSIKPDPNQPRKVFDAEALDELTASIKEHGVLQPIVVTPAEPGKFMIVAGERRYRAAELAKLKTIPALVRTLTAQHKLELSLIENLQRLDLSAIETATAYLKLRDQFNLTLDQIGQRVGGKSTAAVSNTMRLLRLPQSVRLAILERKVNEGQARPLIGLDEETIEAILPRIIDEGWSSRAVEQYVSRLKKSHDKPKPETTKPEQSYDDQTSRLTKRFATSIKIKADHKGGGKIIIPFKNAEDFERISKLMS